MDRQMLRHRHRGCVPHPQPEEAGAGGSQSSGWGHRAFSPPHRSRVSGHSGGLLLPRTAGLGWDGIP